MSISSPCLRQGEPKDITIISSLVDEPPRIDGKDDDVAWSAAESVVTPDYLSRRPITIKTVHTSDSIFFLVKYPDAAPSTTHKSFQWDAKDGIYRPLSDVEDAFVFRWSMIGPHADLLLRDCKPHKADIWFWKAWRTNPVGYADDKWESLSPVPGDNTKKLQVPGQPDMYLRRAGDAGNSAMDEKIPFEYRGAFASRFIHRLPGGSRADVRAKGLWLNGVWTIEFFRKLDTGHDDDVTFKTGGSYLFVVSCYETSGCEVSQDLTQPLFNAGDGFDRLTLRIANGGKDR